MAFEQPSEYYEHHRELVRGDAPTRKKRRAELNANLANHHPIVLPTTQSKWLAQLKRLDDPHTNELALQYIRKHIITNLTQPQIPSFLACFSQSTDHDTRRQCSRTGCLRVFQALCATVLKEDVTKHASRIASAICLYASDPDEAVRSACSRAVQQLVQHTSASLDAAVAPFLALLRSSHRWQAQEGACQCMIQAVETAKNNEHKDSVDLRVLNNTTRKLLNSTRNLLKKLQPRAKPSAYEVLVACAKTLSTAIEKGGNGGVRNGNNNNNNNNNNNSNNNKGASNSSSFRCGPLIRTICDDIALSDASSNGPSWQSRRCAALALGEIILLGKHACLEQEDVEEARTTLENMLFDKVPGVRASVQAVLSLRQLGGNMEQVPVHDASGAHKYGRRTRNGIVSSAVARGRGSRGRANPSPPNSPERGVAMETVDAAIQEAFESTPHGLPPAVTHVESVKATTAASLPLSPRSNNRQQQRQGQPKNKHNQRNKNQTSSPSPPKYQQHSQHPRSSKSKSIRTKKITNKNKNNPEEENDDEMEKNEDEDEDTKNGMEKSLAPSIDEVAAANSKQKGSTENNDDQKSTTSSKRSSRSSRSSTSSASASASSQQQHQQQHQQHQNTPTMNAQIHQIKRQQVVFQNDLKLMRQEMSNMVHHVTMQMHKLENMVTSVLQNGQSNAMKINGNLVPTNTSSSSSSSMYQKKNTMLIDEQEWSRPRKNIEAAKMQQEITMPQHHRGGYQHGGAELVLETCLSNGSDDGEVIRQCNAVGAGSLNGLSIPTRKRLFRRLIDMMDRNCFVLQALPWFQTAFNLRLLTQVLSTPGTYARAVRVFQKYSKAGRTSLSTDCMRLYQVLANDPSGR